MTKASALSAKACEIVRAILLLSIPLPADEPTSSRLRSRDSPSHSTFILRLSCAWTAGHASWRGWIEHLPSGERAAVQDWEGVMAFMRRVGVRWEEGKGSSCA